MIEFDSAVVEDLFHRARSPLDVGAAREELAAALEHMEITPRDRGNLLLTQLVMLQGELPFTDAIALADSALELLLEHGDPEAQVSILAITATILALDGDFGRCFDLCLDATSILRSHPDREMSSRVSSNFASALMVLGAYDLAMQLFVRAVKASLKESHDVAVAFSCANLIMTVSRKALVDGHSVVTNASCLEKLAIAETALGQLATATDESQAFRNACLAHSASLRGDMDAAEHYWGDIDALSAHPSPSFAQYFCIVEAPLAIRRGDLARAHELIEYSLRDLNVPQVLPLSTVDSIRIRSQLHEQTGDLKAALDDAREATRLALSETNGLADLLIAQVDQRAALEEGQRALLSRATALSEQMMIDELSQVGNRRAYDVAIDGLADSAVPQTAVLMCDLDRFKEVNDRFGHSRGDGVIVRAGQILSEACGTSNGVFRYGGDEFVLLPGALSEAEAMAMAENIRQAFRDERWCIDGQPLTITCSVGVWVGPSSSIDQGVAEADRELYQAKVAGRNHLRTTQ